MNKDNAKDYLPLVIEATGPSCENGDHLYGYNECCVMCKAPQQKSELIIPDWVSEALAKIPGYKRKHLSFADIDAIGKAAIAAYRDAEIGRLTAERQALQAFKDYVHQRLDAMDVPTHPDGEHSKAGCRIGDRLDIVQAKLESAERDAARYRHFRLQFGLAVWGGDDQIAWHEEEIDKTIDNDMREAEAARGVSVAATSQR